MKCDTSNRLDVSVLVIGEYSYTRVSLTKSVPIGKAGLQDPFDWGQKGWHVPSGPVTAISCSHTRTYINTNYMQSQQQACLWETFVVYLLKWTRKKKKRKDLSLLTHNAVTAENKACDHVNKTFDSPSGVSILGSSDSRSTSASSVTTHKDKRQDTRSADPPQMFTGTFTRATAS